MKIYVEIILASDNDQVIETEKFVKQTTNTSSVDTRTKGLINWLEAVLINQEQFSNVKDQSHYINEEREQQVRTDQQQGADAIIAERFVADDGTRLLNGVREYLNAFNPSEKSHPIKHTVNQALLNIMHAVQVCLIRSKSKFERQEFSLKLIEISLAALQLYKLSVSLEQINGEFLPQLLEAGKLANEEIAKFETIRAGIEEQRCH